MYKEIARDLQEIFLSGSYSDSWPVGSALAADLIVDKFADDLINYLKTNPKLYPLEASDFFIMLNPRTISLEKKQAVMKYLFRYIKNSRKDILFRTTLDIYNPPIIKKEELLYFKDYNKIVFLLSNLSEIFCPIFRRLNHDIYTYNNLLYRYYRLSNEYLLVSKYINPTKMTFFGHINKVETIEKYNCYFNNKLVKPEYLINHLQEEINKNLIKFSTEIDKLLYVLNSCRKHIGLNELKSIDFKYNINDYIVSKEQKNKIFMNVEKNLESAEQRYISLLGDYNDY